MSTAVTTVNAGVIADDGTGDALRTLALAHNSNALALADGVNKTEINTQTGTTYTLVLADANKLVICDNASSFTLTVPLDATVNFPTGTRIVVDQGGAGQVSFVSEQSSPSISPAINKESGLGTTTRGQYAQAVLTKVAANSWRLAGNLSNIA
jgi:hypothetical protein